MVTRIVILVVAVLLAGCTTTRGGQYCQVAREIRPAAADAVAISDTLVEQIIAHNETGAALCGWTP